VFEGQSHKHEYKGQGGSGRTLVEKVGKRDIFNTLFTFKFFECSSVVTNRGSASNHISLKLRHFTSLGVTPNYPIEAKNIENTGIAFEFFAVFEIFLNVWLLATHKTE